MLKQFKKKKTNPETLRKLSISFRCNMHIFSSLQVFEYRVYNEKTSFMFTEIILHAFTNQTLH